MNNTFDFNRFSLLLKKELWSGNKKSLIIAGAIFGFLILIALLQIYWSGGYEGMNWNMFPLIILGGGLIFTSVIFYEFNDKTGTHHYLSLPASTFEKFLSKWLITAVLFPIIASFLFWVYAKIGDAIYFNHVSETFYTPWKLTDWWSIFFIKLYIVYQSTFLIGAIVFQKYTFFKTSVVHWIYTIVSMVITAILFRIIFANMFDGLFSINQDLNIQTSNEVIHFMENKFLSILEFALWFLVPPIMWVVGFFKLKEKEA
ncbi:MAG: hypothetical protein AB8F94_00595 [Saprospiraceae bacterium]